MAYRYPAYSEVEADAAIDTLMQPYDARDLVAGAVASSEMRRALGTRDPGGSVLFDYVDGVTRYIYHALDDIYALRWKIRQIPATLAWEMAGVAAVRMMAAWDDTAPGITYGGGTWGAASSSGTALGGGYRSTSTASRYVEFQITGFTDLWIAHAKRTNGGITYVTIDGATALVNELPLNGGNRELSMYAATDSHNEWTQVASGLNPASTYTVRLTNSGVAGAGGGTSIHFSGYGYPSSDFSDPLVTALANNAMLERRFSDVAYVWEYAYEIAPVGSTNYQFSGMSHENESLVSAAFEDENGDPVTVDTTTRRAVVDTLTVVQQLYSRHPDTGATNYALVDLEQRFTSRGLEIWHRHRWLTDCVGRNCYPAMFSFDDSTTRGQVAGDFGREYELESNDGSSHGELPALAAALWDPAYEWVGWLYVRDFGGVNGFADTELKMWIQDRAVSGGLYRNKIYYSRITTNPVPITAGETWENTAWYRISQVDPDAVLPLT